MRAILISDSVFDAMVVGALVATGYDTVCSVAAPPDRRADLVVIDFRVFGRRLTELVGTIRGRESTVRLLVLLHLARATERAAILDAGADDCLSRPVDPIELRARVRALERRGGREVFHLGGLSWDWESRQGEIGSTSIALSRSETVVLETLLKSPSQIVPISRLERVLASEAVRTTHNRVYVYICRLRKKLVASGLRIRNVSGVGYSLGTMPLDRPVVPTVTR